MNLLVLTNAILTLLPAITQTVQGVEAMAGADAKGQAKLQLALGILKPIYDATNPPVPFEQIVSQVTTVIGEVVAFYNTVGKFVKAVKG